MENEKIPGGYSLPLSLHLSHHIPRSDAYSLPDQPVHHSHKYPQSYPAPQNAARFFFRVEVQLRKMKSHTHNHLPSKPGLYSHYPSRKDPPSYHSLKDPYIRCREHKLPSSPHHLHGETASPYLFFCKTSYASINFTTYSFILSFHFLLFNAVPVI